MESEAEIRLFSLFDQACNGTLDDTAARELAQRLRESPAARTAYLERCRLDGELFFLTRIEHSDDRLQRLLRGGREDSLAGEAGLTRRAWDKLYRVASHNMALSLLISTLVMTIILLSLELLVPGRRSLPSPPQFVAEVTGIRNVVEADGTAAILSSRALLLGDTLKLQSGLAEVTYRSGTRVVLEGPIEYIVDGANAGTLQSGKLVAMVPPAGVGFTVHSPTATVIDLGTEFGMWVAPAGDTEAHVLEGSIEVHCGPPGDKPSGGRVLSAGESVRIDGGKIIAIERDSADTEQFVRDLPPQAGSDLPAIQPLLQYRPQFAGKLRADGKFTVGTLIEVGEQPLQLTHLGVQDVPSPVGTDDPRSRLTSDGFHQSPVSVGLWNADGSQLLATARVGNSDRLVVNSWRYVRLDEPVQLAAGQRYLLGAYVGGGIEWFRDGHGGPADEQPFVAGDAIAIVGNRYHQGAFAAPSSDGGDPPGRWGAANALVTLAGHDHTATQDAGAPQPGGVE